MSDNENESPLEVTIDTEGMENRIVDKFNIKFQALEEMFTAKEETQALSESKTGDKPVDFDWRVGIHEMLTSFKKNDNITIADWQERRKVEDVSVRTYNEDTKEHEYGLTEKLVETIGTIATDNCCIPEVWADKIERDHVYPGSVFLGAWFVNWYDDIKGKPGDTVHICRVAPSVCLELGCDEPANIAPEIVCPSIELQHEVCATAICKNTMEIVQFGLVDAITEGLGSCLQVCVDNYFFDVAMSCTNAGTLTCTGPIAGSIIVEAMGSMMAGNQKEGGTKHLNSCTHVINPIGFLICKLWEHPKKRLALIVDTLGKVVQLRVKHIAQNVVSILSLIKNGKENIGGTGQKITQNAIKQTIKDTMLDSNHYMKSLEQGFTTNVIYVEKMIKDSNFMKEMESHIQLIPFTLGTTLKTLHYYVSPVTKQHIGQCLDSTRNTTNLRNSYTPSSDQNLQPSKDNHAPSCLGLSNAGHQLQLR